MSDWAQTDSPPDGEPGGRSDAGPQGDGSVEVRRARIEQIRALAAEYKREYETVSGAAIDPPLPSGGIFWIAVDRATSKPLGYAAATLRPMGCTIGPIYTRAQARRRGVGQALLTAIQRWATDTRVPVVEISVAADNTAGQAFLTSLGYEPRRILMSLIPTGAQSAP